MGGKIRSLRTLRLIDLIDTIFYLTPITVALAWLASSLYSLLTSGLWGRAVAFITPTGGLVRPHSLTVLAVASFLLFTHWSLNYLLPHVRAAAAFALTALGYLLYDLTWIIGDYFTCGSGNPLIQLSLVLADLLLLLFYNRFYRFLTFEPLFLLLFIVHTIAMTQLAFSGFYQTLHAGLDPHPGNWLWFAGKATGVWCVAGLYKKRWRGEIKT